MLSVVVQHVSLSSCSPYRQERFWTFKGNFTCMLRSSYKTKNYSSGEVDKRLQWLYLYLGFRSLFLSLYLHIACNLHELRLLYFSVPNPVKEDLEFERYDVCQMTWQPVLSVIHSLNLKKKNHVTHKTVSLK